MTIKPSFAAELVITLSNGAVWLAITEALLFGAVCLVVGIWLTRRIGLLAVDASAGETIGVGLASGLIMLAAWWAAIWSGGRSSFTPVAVGFAIAAGLAVIRRPRPKAEAEDDEVGVTDAGNASSRWSRNRSLILATLAGAVFVVAVALVYGSTIVPSPRDGVQPVEFMDEPFYSILAQDLASTGSETTSQLSGFSDVPGTPIQTWYHWGELWLASAVITIFGAAPLAARYFVVLPLVLLAAATLTGTLVRRYAQTPTRYAYLFGFLACLFLAPVPSLPGPYFSSWAVGMIFAITEYGLAAVAVLLALYGVAVLGTRRETWALAIFVASAAAFILPAHIAIAILAAVGVASVWAIRIFRSLRATGRLPSIEPVWQRTLIATGVALVATGVWGVYTQHGLGGSGGFPPIVGPFNASWRASVALTALGAGVLFAIPLAWLLARKERPALADLCLGTMALLVAGAIAWGARLSDFTMFHFFFGAIAVFATPVAAIATWTIWERLRETRHLRLALAVVIVCVIQLGVGSAQGLIRLQAFGPISYQPIPESLLSAIRQLPADAKLAYACTPLEEFSFGDPRLLSIDAHTGRRVVPMCFEADLRAP